MTKNNFILKPSAMRQKNKYNNKIYTYKKRKEHKLDLSSFATVLGRSLCQCQTYA